MSASLGRGGGDGVESKLIILTKGMVLERNSYVNKAWGKSPAVAEIKFQESLRILFT